jgi:hypothetical protein
MFQSTLALLKSRLRSLRSSNKQKRKSTASVPLTSEVPAENTPTVGLALDTSLSTPIGAQLEVRYERKMGDSELSYYLPSRANGVNDMYVLSPPGPPLELIACVLRSGIFISALKHQTTSWRARECAPSGPSFANDTRCWRRQSRCTTTTTSDLCESGHADLECLPDHRQPCRSQVPASRVRTGRCQISRRKLRVPNPNKGS